MSSGETNHNRVRSDNDDRLLRKATRVFDKARYNYDNQRYDEAVTLYKKSVRIREAILGRHDMDTARSYGAMGQCYTRMDDDNLDHQCLVPYYTSLRIRLYLSAQHDNADDTTDVTSNNSNNNKFEAPKSEVKQYRKCLERSMGWTRNDLEKHEGQMGQSVNLELEGDEYRQLGRYESAIGAYKRALALLPSPFMMQNPTSAFLSRKIALCSCSITIAAGDSTRPGDMDWWKVVDRIHHPNFASHFADKEHLFPVQFMDRIVAGDGFHSDDKCKEAIQEYQRATELAKDHVLRQRMMQGVSSLLERNNLWMLQALAEVNTVSLQDSMVRLQELDDKLESVTRRVSAIDRKFRSIQSFPDETAKVVAVQLEGSMAGLETGLVYKLDQVTKQLDGFDQKLSEVATAAAAAAAATPRSELQSRAAPALSFPRPVPSTESNTSLVLDNVIKQPLERLSSELQQQMSRKMDELRASLSKEMQTSIASALQQQMVSAREPTEHIASVVIGNQTGDDTINEVQQTMFVHPAADGNAWARLVQRDEVRGSTTTVQREELQAMWSEHATAMRHDAKSRAKKLKSKLTEEIATQSKVMGETLSVKLQRTLRRLQYSRHSCQSHPESSSSSTVVANDDLLIVDDDETVHYHWEDGMNFKLSWTLVSYGWCCLVASFLVLLMNGMHLLTSLPFVPRMNRARKGVTRVPDAASRSSTDPTSSVNTDDAVAASSTVPEESTSHYAAATTIDSLLEKCRSSICDALYRIEEHLVEGGTIDHAVVEIRNVSQVVTVFSKELRVGMLETISAATQYCASRNEEEDDRNDGDDDDSPQD
jgi:tetratricopeptide (TPR) repeat protein